MPIKNINDLPPLPPPEKPRAKRVGRDDYRLFPVPYFDALTAFRVHGSVRLGGFTQKAATALRRDLYRFFAYIRAAVPTGDLIASDLSDLTSLIVISIGEHAGRYWVILERNPIANADGMVSSATRQEAMSNLMAALANKEPKP